jgi:hypothetical protein
VDIHRADWAHAGRAAGPQRNARMLASGIDQVLAFRADGPSPGTDDCVAQARARGIPVTVVRARRRAPLPARSYPASVLDAPKEAPPC